MIYEANEKRYEKMQYNRVGKSGLRFPAVSLGFWHNFGSNASYDNMRAMCRTAFDNGITQFDLANNYGPVNGSAEENCGRILKDDFGAYRDELIITTKAGYLSYSVTGVSRPGHPGRRRKWHTGIHVRAFTVPLSLRQFRLIGFRIVFAYRQIFYHNM